MKTYAVKISNVNGEILSWTEFTRPRFTKREYDIIIQEMFYWASEGYNYLYADIYEGDPETLDKRPITSRCEEDFKYLFTVTCYTNISSYFVIKSKCIKVMPHYHI